MTFAIETNQREYEHAKNVTKSMGLKNLYYFQDIDQGIKWLTSRALDIKR
jgi:hypothetical protein